jgi:hypothetical protein
MDSSRLFRSTTAKPIIKSSSDPCKELKLNQHTRAQKKNGTDEQNRRYVQIEYTILTDAKNERIKIKMHLQ